MSCEHAFSMQSQPSRMLWCVVQDLFAVPPPTPVTPHWDSGAGYSAGAPVDENLPVREDPSRGFYVEGLQVTLRTSA